MFYFQLMRSDLLATKRRAGGVSTITGNPPPNKGQPAGKRHKLRWELDDSFDVAIPRQKAGNPAPPPPPKSLQGHKGHPAPRPQGQHHHHYHHPQGAPQPQGERGGGTTPSSGE